MKTALSNQDLNSSQMKNIIVAALEDAKANDIIVIDVKNLTQVTDFMVIASGTSSRHIQTIAESAFKKAQAQGFEKMATEGLGQSEWVVVDFVDVVLHVMSPSAREHYNLEGLWDIDAQQE